MNTLDFRPLLQTPTIPGGYITNGAIGAQGVFLAAWVDYPRNTWGTAYGEPGPGWGADYDAAFRWPVIEHRPACVRVESGVEVRDQPDKVLVFMAIGYYNDELYAVGDAYSDEPREFKVPELGTLNWLTFQGIYTHTYLWKRDVNGQWSVVQDLGDSTGKWDGNKLVPNPIGNQWSMFVYNNVLYFQTDAWTWFAYDGTHVRSVGHANQVATDGDVLYVFNASQKYPMYAWSGPVDNQITPGIYVGENTWVSKPYVWRGDCYVVVTWYDMLHGLPVGNGHIGLAKVGRAGGTHILWDRNLPPGMRPQFYSNVHFGHTEFELQVFAGHYNPDIVPMMYGEDRTLRDWVICFNGRSVRSSIWDRRVFCVVSGANNIMPIGYRVYPESSASHAVRLHADDVPYWGDYNLGHASGGIPGWNTGGHPYGYGWDERGWSYGGLYSANVLEGYNELSVLNADIEFSDGSGGHEPYVNRAEIDWVQYMPWDNEPVVSAVGIDWSDGSGDGSSPEVADAAVGFSDGTGTNSPDLGRAKVTWAGVPSYNDEPVVERLRVDWSDGTYDGPSPEITEVSGRWSVGSGDGDSPEVVKPRVSWYDGDTPDPITVDPYVTTSVIEWKWGRPDPSETDRVLWVTHNDSKHVCKAVQVVSGLGADVDAQIRVLVRADRETFNVDAWDSYEEGECGSVIYLKHVGKFVRVAVVGPDTLPLDTDFHFQFIR